MECKRDKNLSKCNCTYEPCANKGICCDCVACHRARKELPACYFTPEEEKTDDRSIEFYFSRHR